MAEKVFAVPTQGPNGKSRVVPFPGRTEPLRAEGEAVDLTMWWARRRLHGEVDLRPLPVDAAEVPKPRKRIAPPIDSPAPDAAPAEETR